ncbi:MAG TPA: hemerythrin domain-containing protein [Pirellulaceae bacterium]|nr:hemerythrin domain-containing protein [Pirellulaceae bacterium]
MRHVNDSQPFVDHLRREHRRLHEAVQATEAALAQWAGTKHGELDVVQQLTALRSELDRHYTEEEEGGCLEEAESRCPSLAGEVKRIEGEHALLRNEMDRLVEQASDVVETSGEVDRLQRAFQQFAARLRSHEAAENRIMAYGFGAEAMDELIEDLNHVDAGPCACGDRQADAARNDNFKE